MATPHNLQLMTSWKLANYVTIFCRLVHILLVLTPSFTCDSSNWATYTQDQGRVLDITSNLFVGGEGSKSITFETDSLAKCVMICYMNASCASMSYNMMNGTCYSNSNTASSINVIARYDIEYVYTEIPERHDGWYLVFRATQGIGQSVYDAWNNLGHSDDVTSVSANDYGCLTINGDLPCDKHFRHWRMNYWEGVSRVKYGFYSHGRGNFKLVVRGSGLDNITQTLSMANLLHSAGHDLHSYTGPYNYDSVEGYSNCLRRFYLSQSFDSCNEDKGWMFVSDGWGAVDCCSYEDRSSYPQFFYTLTNEAVTWTNQSAVGSAQVFAVFIKYE